MVRFHLDYASSVWFPHKPLHKETIEGVQRRATKQLSEMSHLSYEERLKRLNLFSLTYRRKRGDLIQMFRLIRGLDNIDINDIVTFDTNSTTRGHKYKLKKRQVQKDSRKYYFSERIVNAWNKLPEGIVRSDNLSAFKNGIDVFFWRSIYEV